MEVGLLEILDSVCVEAVRLSKKPPYPTGFVAAVFPLLPLESEAQGAKRSVHVS